MNKIRLLNAMQVRLRQGIVRDGQCEPDNITDFDLRPGGVCELVTDRDGLTIIMYSLPDQGYAAFEEEDDIPEPIMLGRISIPEPVRVIDDPFEAVFRLESEGLRGEVRPFRGCTLIVDWTNDRDLPRKKRELVRLRRRLIYSFMAHRHLASSSTGIVQMVHGKVVRALEAEQIKVDKQLRTMKVDDDD